MASENHQKIIFLDRDGVINEFPGDGLYVTKVKDFRLFPRSVEAISILTAEGFTVFVISNQAGVGRGIYSQKKLDLITSHMIRDIKKAGGRLEKICYCTHPSDAGCACRKPKTGNLKLALRSIGKTMKAAKGKFFIGDTKSDILAGYNAGCKTILVLSGRAKREEVEEWGVKPDFIAADLLEAVGIVIANERQCERRKKSNAAYYRRARLAEKLKPLN